MLTVAACAVCCNRPRSTLSLQCQRVVNSVWSSVHVESRTVRALSAAWQPMSWLPRTYCKRRSQPTVAPSIPLSHARLKRQLLWLRRGAPSLVCYPLRCAPFVALHATKDPR
jgi:hypothetical protein